VNSATELPLAPRYITVDMATGSGDIFGRQSQNHPLNNPTPRRVDETIPDERVAAALRKFDRRKDAADYADDLDRITSAVTGLSVETPTLYLADIRTGINDLVDAVKENSMIMMDMLAAMRDLQKLQVQHTEDITKELRRASERPFSVDPGLSRGTTPMSATPMLTEKLVYYHQDVAIKTPAHVVACILWHMDHIVKHRLGVQDVPEPAAITFKAMVSAVRVVHGINSESTQTTGKVVNVKFSDFETAEALSVIGNLREGKAASLQISHLRDLASRIPGTMGVVEETRERLLKCSGIIGISRAKRLAMLKFPYTASDEDLLINEESNVHVSRVTAQLVSKLSATATKEYATLVLEKRIGYSVAIRQISSPASLKQ